MYLTRFLKNNLIYLSVNIEPRGCLSISLAVFPTLLNPLLGRFLAKNPTGFNLAQISVSQTRSTSLISVFLSVLINRGEYCGGRASSCRMSGAGRGPEIERKEDEGEEGKTAIDQLSLRH